MALQSSGAISLNDIHIEAGGTSGTQASINDADIRTMINKSSGAQASFSEYYGASSSIATINCNLTLSRETIGTTSTDYKGNTTFTATGYRYHLGVNNWNSIQSSNTGMYAVNHFLGTYSSTATSVSASDKNFIGSLGTGTSYDSLKFNHYTETNLSNVSQSRNTYFNIYEIGNGPYNYLTPIASGSMTAPTSWTSINLSFSYGGTNYSWTWTRASHFSSFNATVFNFGGTLYTSAYFLLDQGGSTDFIGAGNSTNITITGATFTIT